MAPSPTGFLHIGGVRTFLFNWLFARQQGGECLLRIENTDTSREVAEAVDQIQDSPRWVGIDWDGPASFQLDTGDRALELAHERVEKGHAYEDEGAIRFRQPKEGTVSWVDAVRGEIEFKNELLPDLVIVRTDGRPTYNFISPVDDLTDGITHVIRGEDHVSNTPTQINILRALGADLPTYAHVPNINGEDGRKLSKRRNAVALDDFRTEGYIPAALFNFLALLGWSYDDKTTIMSRHELVERFSLERVVPSPATFDYQKLDWLNGVYLRALPLDEYADELLRWLRDDGHDWDEELVRRSAPLVQEKIERFGQFPEFAGFLFRDVEPDPALLDGDTPVVAAARVELAGVEPFRAPEIEAALRRRAGRRSAARGAPAAVAAEGVSADPYCGHRLEDLARAVREPGAPREGRVTAATQCC